MITIIIAILVLISGIAKAIADTSASCYAQSKLSKFDKLCFWSKSAGWTNKYKNNDPQQGEKFLGSTTVFVWLTDAWHLFTLITDITLFASAALTGVSWWLVAVFALRQIIFELTYKFLKL